MECQEAACNLLPTLEGANLAVPAASDQSREEVLAVAAAAAAAAAPAVPLPGAAVVRVAAAGPLLRHLLPLLPLLSHAAVALALDGLAAPAGVAAQDVGLLQQPSGPLPQPTQVIRENCSGSANLSDELVCPLENSCFESIDTFSISRVA